MALPSSVPLLQLDPDLGRALPPDERAVAAQMLVPVWTLPSGEIDLEAIIAETQGFGLLLLDGMVLQDLHVDDHSAMRLLGPGDVLASSGFSGSTLLASTGCRVAADTNVAVLGVELLRAVQHWPRLAAGLQARAAEQSGRLAAQLAICQLPRVDRRVLSVLWLLAETWGHVTSAGTRLPLSLTHEVLGGLIGARRPTVTLALGELTERGAIVRQEDGWLLLEPPPEPQATMTEVEPPVLTGPLTVSLAPASEETRRKDLNETVERLRAQHLEMVERHHRSLEMLRARRLRAGGMGRRATRPPDPSSGSRR